MELPSSALDVDELEDGRAATSLSKSSLSENGSDKETLDVYPGGGVLNSVLDLRLSTGEGLYDLL
jgi:hypothetical protein